jgi:FlaA1/EpsC-like NDP-sugar epimerase
VVVPVLASVRDNAVVTDVIREHKVQTIFHAAAFKHVPIVERDPIAGVINNIFATTTLARIAIDCGVERFVLISTDKAVRPSSVMGATKRLAELILQDMSRSPRKTTFCCVRFGNVLGSSGSVVERFTEQIRRGGPVTVTHPDMVRYFMSVEEAASLVIQSATLAKGGDTFLLDMGEPISILELARSLIRLMGHVEYTRENPTGDIEIVLTGLRPGEKIREELLIDMNTVVGTLHPRIMKSHEPSIDPVVLHRELDNLRRAVELRDVGLVVASLEAAIADYKPSGSVLHLATRAATDKPH